MERCDELEVIFNNISTKTEFQEMVDKLQILSYNERANEKVLSLVEKSIAKGLFLEDKKNLIKLYSFKITHLQHLKENLPTVINLVKKITYSIILDICWCLNSLENRKGIDVLKDLQENEKDSIIKGKLKMEKERLEKYLKVD